MTVADQYAAAMVQLTAARTGQIEAAGTCRVTRPAVLPQTPALDADGRVITPADEVVYEGPGIVSDPSSARLSDRTSNDDAGTPNARIGKAPHDADLRPGDLWEQLTAPYAPGLVGDRFVVQGEEERAHATYRRYVLRGSSWLPGQ